MYSTKAPSIILKVCTAAMDQLHTAALISLTRLKYFLDIELIMLPKSHAAHSKIVYEEYYW
jgi:hypothetical protein